MEPSRIILVTDSFNVVLKDVQLNTVIILKNFKTNEQITLDIDQWTQFKQNIEAIDTDFYKRFNYQYSNL